MIKVLANLVSGESSLPVLQRTISHYVLVWPLPSASHGKREREREREFSAAFSDRKY